jgi:hypothetical protein
MRCDGYVMGYLAGYVIVYIYIHKSICIYRESEENTYIIANSI